MKRKPFPPQLQKFHLAIAFCFFTLLFTSCNSNNTEPVTEDWLNLTIKFKEGTPQIIRDISMRTIENYIADSIKKMNDGDYKDFHPRFLRITDPRDSSVIGLTIGLRDSIGRPQHYQSGGQVMSSSAPPCKCSTECRICRIAKALVSQTIDAVPAFPLTDYIISTETAAPNPKDNTDKKK